MAAEARSGGQKKVKGGGGARGGVIQYRELVLTWLWRLIVVGFPPAPGISALRRRVEDVEKTVEQFVAEVKEQRGRITSKIRREKPLQDDPGQEIEEEAAPQDPPVRLAPRGTAHLARRFKSGG